MIEINLNLGQNLSAIISFSFQKQRVDASPCSIAHGDLAHGDLDLVLDPGQWAKMESRNSCTDCVLGPICQPAQHPASINASAALGLQPHPLPTQNDQGYAVDLPNAGLAPLGSGAPVTPFPLVPTNSPNKQNHNGKPTAAIGK